MAGSVDTKDPLGLEAQLQQTKTSTPDPLGLEAQLKKKSSSENALPSGVNVSGSGSDAFLPSQQPQMPLYSMATPALREKLQKDDQRYIQQSLDKEQRAKDASAKMLKDYYNHLTDDEKVKLENVANHNKPFQDEVHQATPEEIADEQAMDTPLGKAIKTAESLGSNFSKGAVALVKGAAYLMDKSGIGGKQFHQALDVSKNFDKDIDKATDLGLSAGQKQQIEEGKGLGYGALRLGNMLAEFAPAAFGGEAVGSEKAAFFIQGLGQGKETIDHAEENGAKINPNVKDLFIVGNGIANSLFLGDAAETIVGKMPSALRKNIVNEISAEALKNATSEATFKELLEKGTRDFADKFQKFGLGYLERFKRVSIDLAGLTTSDWMLKKGVDQTTDKPVFNQTPGQLAEGLENVAKQAPVFAAFGSLPELTKLTPYSDFKNDIIQHIAEHPEDAESVKQDMVNHGVRNGWTPDEIKATNDHITQIAEAASKLPQSIKPEKKTAAVQLLMDRDKLQGELDKLQASKEKLDPAVKEIPSEQEIYLTTKIEQANDKLADMVRGTKTTYSKEREENGEETGKFLKTTWKDKKAVVQEEITPERYQLESIERDSNIQPDEEAPKEGDAGEETPAVTTEEGTGQEAVHNQEKEVLSPEDQKAIDYITHGLIVPEGIKENDPSARIDLGMKTSEKKKALADISNGKYDTAPARKLIEKVKEFEKNNDYPIIEGLGGASVRRNGITSEEMAGHFEDAKANKIGELSQRQIDEFNEAAKELGITAEDVKNYEDYQQSLRGESDGGTAKGVPEAIPESADDKAAGSAQAGSDKTTQKQEGVDNATEKVSKQKGGGGEHQEGDGSRKKPKTGSSDSPERTKKGESKPQKEVGKFSIKKKTGDPLREFANKVREGKISKLGGFRSSSLFDKAWDGSLEAVATALEGGAKLADAIEAGLKHIRKTKWYKKLKDKQDFENQYREHLNNEYEATRPEKTGIRHEDTAKERAASGTGTGNEKGIPKDRSHEAIVAEGKKLVDADPMYAAERAKDIIDKNRPASDVEQAAILYRLTQLKNRRRALLKDTDPDNRASNEMEIARNEDEKAYLMKASDIGGSELGSGLGFRTEAMHEDYSTETVINRATMANDGKKLKPEDEGFLKEKTKRIEELEDQLADREDQIRKLQEDALVNKVKKAAEKRGGKITRASLAKEREELFKELHDIAKKSRGQLGVNSIPVEMVAPLAKLARNYVLDGILTLSEVVDKIYDEFKNDLEGLKKDDIADAVKDGFDKYLEEHEKLKLDEAKARAKKSIEDLQGRIDRKEYKRPTKPGVTPDEELNSLKKQIAEHRKTLKDLEIESKGGKERVDLENRKQRLSKKLEDLKKKYEGQTIDEKVERKKLIDNEYLNLQAEIKRQQELINGKIQKLTEANESVDRRAVDMSVKWGRQFKLSSPVTAFKLMATGLTTGGITAVQEGVGKFWSAVLPKVAYKSSVEGSVSGKALHAASRITERQSVASLSQAYARAATKGMKDAYEEMNFKKGGQSNLSLLYGKYLKTKLPAEAADFFGHLHSAIKAPVKRFAWEHSYAKRVAKCIEKGLDPLDPTIDAENRMKAYVDASRAIFMGDNFISKSYEQVVSKWEHGEPWEKDVAAAFRIALPFVKVPTNIVLSTIRYAFGAPVAGLKLGRVVLSDAAKRAGNEKLAQLLHKNMGSLSEDEADIVLRNLKRGSIGGAALAIGFLNPKNVGGYYQKGEHRQPSDAKEGGFVINGVHIPLWMAEHPIFQAMQIGATFRKVLDAHMYEGSAGAIKAASLATAAGIGKHIPQGEEFSQFTDIFDASNTHKFDRFVGDLIKGEVIPAAMQQAAVATDVKPGADNWIPGIAFDPDNQQGRQPDKYHGMFRYIWQDLKTGVPWARETVNPK